MSGEGSGAPLGDDSSQPNPFAGMPLFGDLANLLRSQGPLNWEAARSLALSVAGEGESTGNVDPSVRIDFERLTRIADMYIRQQTGLDTAVGGRDVTLLPVTAATWASRALDAYRPFFVRLASALDKPIDQPTDTDAGLAMIAGLQRMMLPTTLGMAAGSMVGHLSKVVFGDLDLPIPRPASHEIAVVSARVDAFGNDWSLARDDLRLWVCIDQLTSAAVLAVPHVRAALTSQVDAFAAAFRPDPDGMMRSFDDIDADGLGDMQDALAKMLGRPETLLGAVASAEQKTIEPALHRLVGLLVTVIDHHVDQTAHRLIGARSALAEAVRRRRLELSRGDHSLERLFGLHLDRTQLEQGQRFVEGVVERAGEIGLRQLWLGAEALPTAAELDAPGLWLARLDLTA